jgi:hypothetical protein
MKSARSFPSSHELMIGVHLEKQIEPSHIERSFPSRDVPHRASAKAHPDETSSFPDLEAVPAPRRASSGILQRARG